MGSRRKKRVKVGNKYYLSLHYVLCHGPVDVFAAMIVEEDRFVWTGGANQNIQEVVISNPKILGENAGGFAGKMTLSKGVSKPSILDKVYGGRRDVPHFKGVTSLLSHDLYVGNNPYLTSPDFVVGRVLTKTDYTAQWEATLAPMCSYIWGKDLHFYLHFAVDLSGSMNESVGGGLTRLDVAKSELIEAVKAIGDMIGSGVRCSVYMWGWSSSVDTSITVENMKLNDTSRLISWIESLQTYGRTDFEAGVTPWVNWRDSIRGKLKVGTTKNVFYFITDGEPNPFSSLQAARGKVSAHYYYSTELVDTVASVLGTPVTNPVLRMEPTIFQGINIDLSNTTYTDQLTGGGTIVVSSQDHGALYSAILNALSAGGRTTDINPVHVIRECLTDSVWGLGMPESDLDDTAFKNVAQTCFDEKFCTSFYWTQQGSILDFINNVLVHINGVLVEDRVTGKLKLKLIRGDYDKTKVRELNETNVAAVDGFSVPSAKDLVSQVVVTYTDVVRNATATAVAHNTAMYDNNNVKKVEYNGITRFSVASRVAERDLRIASTPLASCTIVCTSDASNIEKGDVVKLTWPKYEVYGMYFRVFAVNYGDGTNNAVELECVQDVFSTPEQPTVVEEEQQWEPSVLSPLKPKVFKVTEPSYFELVMAEGDDFASSVEEGETVLSGYFIRANSQQDSVMVYEKLSEEEFLPLSDETLYAEEYQLEDDLPWDSTQLDMDELLGNLALINDEIVYFDPDGTLFRGLFDTIPKTHPKDSYIIPLDDVNYFNDATVIIGETTDILIVPQSPYDKAGPDEWVETSVPVRGRYLLPYPPAAVKINGAFVEKTNLPDLQITWRDRNRIQQTGGTPISWFEDASVTLEEGVTYKVFLSGGPHTELIHDGDNEPISFDIRDYESFIESTNPRIILRSVRDGLESWEDVVIPLDLDYELDPYWDSVVSLNHFDSPSTDTLGLTWETKEYNLATPGRFGARCADLEVSGTWADNLPPEVRFDNPFTLEFWAYQTEQDANNKVIFIAMSNDVPIISLIENGDKVSLRIGEGSIITYESSPVLKKNQWVALALSYTGTRFILHGDGEICMDVAVAEVFPSSYDRISYGLEDDLTGLLDDEGDPLTLTSSKMFVDESKLTCGVARYVSKYTPREIAFWNEKYHFYT
jgi:hypothetical protein